MLDEFPKYRSHGGDICCYQCLGLLSLRCFIRAYIYRAYSRYISRLFLLLNGNSPIGSFVYGKEPGTSKLRIMYVTKEDEGVLLIYHGRLPVILNLLHLVCLALFARRYAGIQRSCAIRIILYLYIFFNSINVSSMSRFPYVPTRTTGVFKPEKRQCIVWNRNSAAIRPGTQG